MQGGVREIHVEEEPPARVLDDVLEQEHVTWALATAMERARSRSPSGSVRKGVKFS